MKNLNIFFTEYDDSIAGENLRDPMGTQVIWSYFGQKFFGKCVTTVADDIRNFSINLFTHSAAEKIINDPDFHMTGKCADFFSSKKSLEFYKSLIIFFENIIIYSLMSAENKQVNTIGILGSSNAIKRLEFYNNNPPLVFDQNAGILVRQFAMGINGRYKGPFINMDIFNTNFEKGKNFEPDISDKIFPELSNLLIGAVKNLIVNYDNLSDKPDNTWFKELDGKKKYFSTRFNNISNIIQIKKKCIDYFKDYTSVKNLKEFWIEKLGFNTGDVKKVYEELNPNFVAHKIFKDDISNNPQVTAIKKVEPVLTSALYIFDSLRIREYNHIKCLAKQLENKKLNLNEIKNAAEEARTEVIHKIDDNNTVKKRLGRLIDIFEKSSSIEDVLKDIAFYHKEIEKGRGLPEWLSITNDNKIFHYSGLLSLKDLKDFDISSWRHDYYLSSVYSIKKGLL